MNKSLSAFWFVLILNTIHSTGVQSQHVRFKKHIIHREFISEGVAVADVNNDGMVDILSGPYWFEAPDWNAHEIRAPIKFDYKSEWSDSFINFAMDVNQDSWTDLIVFDFPGKGVYWYENPKGKAGHWQGYLIDSTARNESPMMADVDQDGRMDLVFGSGNEEMRWFRPPEKGNKEWTWFSISQQKAPGAATFSHGLGFGDLNLDGRKDVVVTRGWWQAPTERTDVPWRFHQVSLGQPCSQMYVFDFDKDGDSDVITSSAHDFGIWWHEQVDPNEFVEHVIDSSFSQAHGAALEDLNGDDLPDLITGKRYFAHNGKDPGGHDPAVLYWFELNRNDQGRPQWKRHLIDDDSGVGVQVVVHDMNGDDKKDIVVSNKKGVIYFESY